jgi:hypothetical protein
MAKGVKAVIALVALAVLLSGCLQSAFDQAQKQYNDLEAQYSEGGLLPQDPEKLAAMEDSVKQLRAQATDDSAKAFLDIKISTLEIRKNLLEAAILLQGSNVGNIECSGSAALPATIAYLEGAQSELQLAKVRVQNFVSAYPQLADRVADDKSSIDALSSGLDTQISYLRQLQGKVC